MKIILATYSGNKQFFDMFIPDPGIAQISGALKKIGIKPTTFDLNLPGNSFGKFLTLVRSVKPDIIGFKFFDTGFRGVIRLSEIIKKELPRSIIVAAGPHVTLFREHIYHKTNAFDFLVIGEGEKTIIALIDYITGTIKLKNDIPNVMYLENHQIKCNEHDYIYNLDELPYPDWSSINLNNYFPLILLNTQRGCANHCAFCAHNYLWGATEVNYPDRYYKPIIRKKSFARICDETNYIYDSLGIKLIGFTDSMPEREPLIDWASYILKTNKSLLWTSFSYVGQFTLDELSHLNNSGCQSLWIGVESGDPTILKLMGKYYSRKDVIETFKDIRMAGIVGVPGFVVGFPGETVDSLSNTLSLIKEVRADATVISPFILDPGSPVAMNPDKYGVKLDQDWECNIVLRDDLNEFEIPYYKINQISNDVIWSQFESISGYKGWNADRSIAESEYAYLFAKVLDVSINEFVSRANKALATDPLEINTIISDVWKSI